MVLESDIEAVNEEEFQPSPMLCEERRQRGPFFDLIRGVSDDIKVLEIKIAKQIRGPNIYIN